MQISVIQSQEKFSYWHRNPGDFDFAKCKALAQTGIDEGFEMMEAAAKSGSKLIVTIEGFNRSISLGDERYDFKDAAEPMDGPLISRFRKLSGKYGIYIVAGLFTTRDDRVYNSGVMFDPSGNVLGIYDKVHLPLGEDQCFTAGDKYHVYETECGNIGILVCWDMQFPEAAREVSLAGADIIACPTWGWENIYGLCRAYENGVAIAAAMGVTYEGEIYDFCNPSCIVENTGKIAAAGTRLGPQIVTADLDLKREPPLQYSLENITKTNSMRQIRMCQRRPDTYSIINDINPPILKRYGKTTNLR
jgi:predicted amidohydrolase